MDQRADDSPGPVPRPATDSPEADRFLAAHPGVERIDVLLPDTNGLMRGKRLPASSLGKLGRGGFAMPFSVFGIDCWGREVAETGLHLDSGDLDGVCLPVPGTLFPVPWSDGEAAQVLVTMHEPDGTPFWGDARHRLADVVGRLAADGLTAVTAFELEFYLVRDDGEGVRPEVSGTGPDRQNMYSMDELDRFDALFEAIRLAAAGQELPVDTIVSEASPGQFEVNLTHRADPLAAADQAVLLRRLIAGVARSHGYRASFMAKPFADFPGNGMHVHASLIGRDGRNIFANPGAGEARLSAAAAGLLDTMADCTALFVGTWNGYRRLIPGSYAPTRASWGHDNRSVAVRVPHATGPGRRLEHRISGADANPYLVLAAILGGMRAGLERGRAAPQPVDGNAYDAPGEVLPSRMADALDRFAASRFAVELLGARYVEMFAAVKAAERAAFEREISPLEYETYL